MNNLDPEVAERPEDLVVYGGTGKAARSWPAYDAIVRSLRDLEDDETLLVQSGKPVGVMRTHEWAPRVLIANSNLVGDWANWEEFRRLEDLGLTMYGQMTAGSWIYIGTQGILQGTFETFAAVADKRFGGTLAGTITLTAGLGGMGGAQPLAVTMNDGVAICVDVDQSRITRRIEHRYLDEQADSLEDAVARAVAARDERRPLSIGVLGNAAELFPKLLEIKAPIDIVTDQTSAHDPLSYLPVGVAFEDWKDAADRDPDGFTKDAQASMAAHVRAMVEFQDAGAEVFDYGNSIRDEARKGGYDRAFDFPGFVPAYIRPLFCEGKGPFRWAALSGDPADIAATDRAILELFPDNERLHKWIKMAGERVQFQGLPARICWLGYGERHLAGLKFNEMVASGELKAPIVIGRDHLDCGSVASPYRETEAMLDGSDAIADWAILNALVNTSSGATWVSFHHGGGVGMGRSLHAGQVCVADGTDAGRPEDRARPHQRPRHGRHPPRRRRLRPGRPGRRGPRRPHPHVGGLRALHVPRASSGGVGAVAGVARVGGVLRVAGGVLEGGAMGRARRLARLRGLGRLDGLGRAVVGGAVVDVGVDPVGGAEAVLHAGLLDLYGALGGRGVVLGAVGLGTSDLGAALGAVGLTAQGVDVAGRPAGLGAQLESLLATGLCTTVAQQGEDGRAQQDDDHHDQDDPGGAAHRTTQAR